MPRRAQLATEESKGLLTARPTRLDRFLCRALTGNTLSWSEIPETHPPEFLQHCRHHGVAALLYHRAQTGEAWQSWPHQVREDLAAASRAGIAQDLLARHHLAELIEALADRAIPYLLMKGEALATSHYPEPGTRSRSDTDLFIRPEDIAPVRAVVLGLGYEIRSPIFTGREFTVMRHGDVTGNVRFDIHWRILNTPRFAQALTFEEAFEASVPVSGLSPARMLCPADALLLACMHRLGSDRHDPDRLIWLHDIHVIALEIDDSEWERFTDQAVKSNVQEPCLDGLATASTYFGCTVPDWVLNRLNRSAPNSTARDRAARSSLALLAADWRDLPDARSRLGMLKELILPSPALVLSKYGKSNRLWLPFLYARRAIIGLANRLKPE